MNEPISRRNMLKTLAIGAGTVMGISAIDLQAATAAAAKPTPAAAPTGPPHLDPNEAAAKALGYMPNAKLVDVKTNPMYKVGSNCSNCLQLQGKVGDAFRPCNLFPGKLVSAGGWCRVYAKKA
jgi:hypothetical protein